MPDTSEFDKMKDVVQKVGLKTIILATFGYFFMMFLIPLGLLTIIATITKIPATEQSFGLFATVLFIAYFAQDFIQILRNKFTLTLAVIISIIVAILIVIKVFNESINLLSVDDTTPEKFRRKVFPLNLITI
jgi:drug/metabolite transporter (DMT)-like permease